MRKLLPLIALGVLSLASCEVTINEGGTNTEGKDGQVKNGFSYDQLKLDINGIHTITNGELPMGENLTYSFQGVENGTLKNGFQHVGLGIKVTTAEDEILIEEEDLLSKIEQQDADLDEFYGHYGIPSKLPEGTEITVELTLFDKYGELSYSESMDYTLVKKRVDGTDGVEYETNLEGLDIDFQLFIEEFQLEKCPAVIYDNDDLYLYINGVSGMTEENNQVSLEYSIKLFDAEGAEVFSMEDVMEGSVIGYDYYPVNYHQDFGTLSPGEYLWQITLKDTKSDKYLKAMVPVLKK